MRILLDECVPRVVKRLLPGRDISTVQDVGWAGLKNGELLAAADGEFGVFITSDKNLRHQQNLSKYGFAVILLPSNSVPEVEALIPTLDSTLAVTRPGQLIEISSP